MSALPLAALITLFIVGGLVIGVVALYLINKIFGDNKKSVYINRNGVVVEAKSPKSISTKQFVGFMKEIINYVEDLKEDYVDDVIGIKNLYFKQSKDFAKARILEVQNAIIEDYKMQYMSKYSGGLHHLIRKDDHTDYCLDATVKLPTALQMNKTDEDTISNSPCKKICTGGCNSGLSFFESHLQKDFKPVVEETFRIIEENHLVNRLDREYEEEITTKAGELSSHIKNRVISYPIPIDNEIAKNVIYEKTPDLKDAIEDSLRRSRTLSKEKREHIQTEKEKYYRKRDTQISQIITILNDDDVAAILRRTDRRSTDEDDIKLM